MIGLYNGKLDGIKLWDQNKKVLFSFGYIDKPTFRAWFQRYKLTEFALSEGEGIIDVRSGKKAIKGEYHYKF